MKENDYENDYYYYYVLKIMKIMKKMVMTNNEDQCE